MNRKCLSGAQKRRLAEEKKDKEEKNLSKFPKIRDLFSVLPSTSSASTSSSLENTENITSEIEENAESVVCTPEFHEIESETDTENITSEIDGNIEAVVCAPAIQGIESETGGYDSVPSADPCLWNVQSDKSMLQNYWIARGKYDGFENEENEFLIVFFFICSGSRSIFMPKHRRKSTPPIHRQTIETDTCK